MMLGTILVAGAAIVAFVLGKWLGAKAFEAHARAHVAKLLRDPDDMDEQAEFLRQQAKDVRERRKGG